METPWSVPNTLPDIAQHIDQNILTNILTKCPVERKEQENTLIYEIVSLQSKEFMDTERIYKSQLFLFGILRILFDVKNTSSCQSIIPTIGNLVSSSLTPIPLLLLLFSEV